MTDFDRLVKQLGGNPNLKPGEIGISNVQNRNTQATAAASKPVAAAPVPNIPMFDAVSGAQGAHGKLAMPTSPNPTENRKILAGEWNAMNNGNIKYEERQYVTPDMMYKVGWNSQQDKKNLQGKIASTYTQGYYGDDFATTPGDARNGYMEISPIVSAKNILSPQAIEAYAKKLYASGDPLNADKKENGGLGIIVRYWDKAPSDENLDTYFSDLNAVKQADAAEYQKPKSTVTPTSAGKTNWVKLLGGTLLKGADEAVSGITSTVNNVLGEPAQEAW